ncbi:hypothetical protein [Legionella longbeachae]|uniref:hypothetical protein n=1 Tax=Legionella longbeachae TaxID=450 RepID=UPI000F719573|nr:hypothetical protein [Legionella longbeachae]UAK48460.1 hypothetical protein K8O86_13510 [Legionella longbeachae]VEE02735.1 putative sodium/hydrogen exchanger family protein [Legionella oakridgensis]
MMDWSLIHASPFYELTSLLMMATIVGFFCLLLRQPMIVGFMAPLQKRTMDYTSN